MRLRDFVGFGRKRLQVEVGSGRRLGSSINHRPKVSTTWDTLNMSERPPNQPTGSPHRRWPYDQAASDPVQQEAVGCHGGPLQVRDP